jgi:hypothetical protein
MMETEMERRGKGRQREGRFEGGSDDVICGAGKANFTTHLLDGGVKFLGHNLEQSTIFWREFLF